MKQKVAVGLSGGVDSSVAAALLIERGYEVTGVYITCWSGLGCRSEEDRQDALDIALQLGIPFVHLDYQKEYREKVYEYMISEYKAGRTPNPDVMCNKEIKFGLFYEWALRQAQGKPSFDFVATGHYAQVQNSNQQLNFGVLGCLKASASVHQNSDCCLLRSKDEHKDQTYFLWQLRQEQLAHILFPIGHLTKQQVRQEAEKRKLLTAQKPDSQGICFIGEVSVPKFLEERIEKKEGKIILLPTRLPQTTSSTPCRHGGVRLRASLSSDSLCETEVGKHRGVWFYTVGQKVSVIGDKSGVISQKKYISNLRKLGFDTTNLPHFYVVKKDLKNNILYVGTKEQLYIDTIRIGELHWINERKVELVRIRHGGELIGVKEIQISNDKLQIMLEKPVWGVAPGQSVGLYKGEECLGGGLFI